MQVTWSNTLEHGDEPFGQVVFDLKDIQFVQVAISNLDVFIIEWTLRIPYTQAKHIKYSSFKVVIVFNVLSGFFLVQKKRQWAWNEMIFSIATARFTVSLKSVKHIEFFF